MGIQKSVDFISYRKGAFLLSSDTSVFLKLTSLGSQIEKALLVSLLLATTTMAIDDQKAGNHRLARNFENRTAEAQQHAQVIRQLLESGSARSGASDSADAHVPSC